MTAEGVYCRVYLQLPISGTRGLSVTEYEFMFLIDPVDDDLERLLADECDGFVGGHGRTTILTMSFDGTDAVNAAQAAIADLRQRGVRIKRVYDDLVTRGQIAERANVTRQAVGLWVRGQRQAGWVFPEPFVLSGGGLWRWEEVNAWLRQAGLPHDDVHYLTAQETARVNAWLPPRTSSVQIVFGHSSGKQASVVAHSTTTTHQSGDTADWLSTAANSKRTDFALGA